ncbi:4-oxalomesaconate tautomerase [Chromatiales bacterium (ex Bugula neritina AB1)]|nr:4-oxalomesaconate tautomerase [Chromatiales bacterium (ex Bugula neritina AB1)]
MYSLVDGVPCTWMRGGTSKAAYFLKDDLPGDIATRDRLLLSIMGSPDPRQIDGIGGADPLSSKVAIVSVSDKPGAQIDYLFLQVYVDQAIVTDAQNCGNILSGVGQFALECKLLEANNAQTEISVYMVNSDQIAQVTLQTPGGRVTYQGDARIDGVPGTSAAVLQNFPEAAGASCGALLPTGNQCDIIDGYRVTLIDNGMPVVVVSAEEIGIDGYETREELDNNLAIKQKLESIRLQAGPLMNLGDVTEKTVPKMTMVAKPANGGVVCTRTFIPHRCHASIGVLGAVSVATACMLPESPAAEYAELPEGEDKTLAIEHPIGETSVVMNVSGSGTQIKVNKAAILRTARKLFSGTVYPSIS